MQKIIAPEYKSFLKELKDKIATSRYQAARIVNKSLIHLYHYIGQEILKRQEQHGWGAKILNQLSQDLSSSFPEMKGFSLTNLKYMRLFAQSYSLNEISQQLADQLPWFHLVTILVAVKDKSARIFYISRAVQHGWSRNVLSMQIETKLYEREGKAISNFKEMLPPAQSDLAEQTLKDPYLFDFLSLHDKAQEREIEKALMQHMEKFLLELGAGFAFVGRQHHLYVGGEDFYIDLLFYHLRLKSYVVIELKAGKFKPGYAGKMNFYLSAVDSLVKQASDNPSIGIILCRSKNGITAEYALQDIDKPIGLAEYRLDEQLPENIKTALPSIEELEAALKEDFSD